MQDPGILGNGLLGNSLANQLGAAGLADSLGLTQGLSAIPAPQNLPGGGGLGFNGMGGLGNGQHAADALAQVSISPGSSCRKRSCTLPHTSLLLGVL
jgi:hypothetical protein